MVSGRHLSVWQNTRLLATCISIAANALSGGAIFTFPLLSNTLASQLKLTQPQLTTIVLAGVVGQYPFSAFVGKIIDTHGPSVCSFAASILFSAAFLLFSGEVSANPIEDIEPPSAVFYRLTFYFGLAGLATVFCFFSIIFSATRLFQRYIGAATGTTMALFGLSPLLLSVIASKFFTDPESGFNVPAYLKFIAFTSGIAHLIGGFFMYERPLPSGPIDSETAPLLAEHEDQAAIIKEQSRPVMDLFRDPNFWLLAFSLIFILGSSEMVLANMGAIVLSLPRAAKAAPSPFQDDDDTAVQVQILSLSNTISRVVTGTVADLVSPVPIISSLGAITFPRRRYMSRALFLALAAVVLSVSFLFTEVEVSSRRELWVLSLGAGLSYGATFTILPGIMRSIWGKADEGRNFGIISYAPFVGTPIFSYLYAYLSSRTHDADDGVICHGKVCWQTTILVCFVTTALALGLTLRLWMVWRPRI